MKTLGIIYIVESTRNKKEIKKRMVKSIIKEYKDLEDFAKKNIKEVETISGYRAFIK